MHEKAIRKDLYLQQTPNIKDLNMHEKASLKGTWAATPSSEQIQDSGFHLLGLL